MLLKIKPVAILIMNKKMLPNKLVITVTFLLFILFSRCLGFKNFFESAHSYEINVNLVPPEHRDEFVASQKFDLKFYGLSDAVIIAVPLMSDDENCTAVNSIYSAFVATCGIGLLSLIVAIILVYVFQKKLGMSVSDERTNQINLKSALIMLCGIILCDLIFPKDYMWQIFFLFKYSLAFLAAGSTEEGRGC